MILFKLIKNFINILLVYLLLLYPAFAKDKNIILEADGIGVTESLAISNALDILSQQIYVSIESQIRSSEKLNNNSFSTEVENNSLLSSNGYFQNISVYNKKKSKKKGFELTVGLTPESISSTIDYLFLHLQEEKVYSLSKSALKEQLNMSNFLFSLMAYAKKNNIQHSVPSTQLNEYIQKINKILSSDSRIKFLVCPQAVDSLITIEKTEYKAYINVYLAKGKYFYEVKAKGYKTIQDSINLNKGDDFEIEVYLQKKLNSLVPIQIKVINETKINSSLIMQKVKSLVSNNQMKESSSSSNYIEFHFSEKISKSVISGYNNNSFDVIIKSRINRVEKNETISINNLSKDDNQQVFQNNVLNQLNKKSQMFFARLFD